MKWLLLLFIPYTTHAQFIENFLDDDLSNDPVWQGDTDKFIIEDRILRSASNQVDDKFGIYTTLDLEPNFQWEIHFALDLRTSSRNTITFSLFKDSISNDGLFLVAGESNDHFRLYQVSNSQETTLLTSRTGISENCNTQLTITIQNDTLVFRFLDNGVWNSMSTAYSTVASTGLFCVDIMQSTASFHHRHFVSYLRAGNVIKDTVAPQVLQLNIAKDSLFLSTNEPLLLSFTTIAWSGIPLEISETTSLPNYSCNLPEIKHTGRYMLELHLVDMERNESDTLISVFINSDTNLDSGHLAINEIMFYPDNGIEFIEIFNPKSSNIAIEPLKLVKYNTSSLTTIGFEDVADRWIEAGGFIIVTNKRSEFIATYTCNPNRVFEAPNLLLNNSEGTLVLKYFENSIDSIRYSNTWHSPLLTSTKGVSIERIDPQFPGFMKDSWISSPGPNHHSALRTNHASKLTASTDSIYLIYQTIDPDGSGLDDLLYLRYSIAQYLSFYPMIFDLDGRLLNSTLSPKFIGGHGICSIDPTDHNGNILQEGSYILLITGYTESGKLLRRKMVFTVVSH